MSLHDLFESRATNLNSDTIDSIQFKSYVTPSGSINASGNCYLNAFLPANYASFIINNQISGSLFEYLFSFVTDKNFISKFYINSKLDGVKIFDMRSTLETMSDHPYSMMYWNIGRNNITADTAKQVSSLFCQSFNNLIDYVLKNNIKTVTSAYSELYSSLFKLNDKIYDFCSYTLMLPSILNYMSVNSNVLTNNAYDKLNIVQKGTNILKTSNKVVWYQNGTETTITELSNSNIEPKLNFDSPKWIPSSRNDQNNNLHGINLPFTSDNYSYYDPAMSPEIAKNTVFAKVLNSKTEQTNITREETLTNGIGWVKTGMITRYHCGEYLKGENNCGVSIIGTNSTKFEYPTYTIDTKYAGKLVTKISADFKCFDGPDNQSTITTIQGSKTVSHFQNKSGLFCVDFTDERCESDASQPPITLPNKRTTPFTIKTSLPIISLIGSDGINYFTEDPTDMRVKTYFTTLFDMCIFTDATFEQWSLNIEIYKQYFLDQIWKYVESYPILLVYSRLTSSSPKIYFDSPIGAPAIQIPYQILLDKTMYYPNITHKTTKHGKIIETFSTLNSPAKINYIDKLSSELFQKLGGELTDESILKIAIPSDSSKIFDILNINYSGSRSGAVTVSKTISNKNEACVLLSRRELSNIEAANLTKLTTIHVPRISYEINDDRTNIIVDSRIDSTLNSFYMYITNQSENLSDYVFEINTINGYTFLVIKYNGKIMDSVPTILKSKL